MFVTTIGDHGQRPGTCPDRVGTRRFGPTLRGTGHRPGVGQRDRQVPPSRLRSGSRGTASPVPNRPTVGITADRKRRWLAYPSEYYPHWRAELGRPSMGPGAFGENLVVAGLTEHDVRLGDGWDVGAVRLRVGQPRRPCWKPARRREVSDLVPRIQSSGRTGWYLRVLSSDFLQAGDAMILCERPTPGGRSLGWATRRTHPPMPRPPPGSRPHVRPCPTVGATRSPTATTTRTGRPE